MALSETRIRKMDGGSSGLIKEGSSRPQRSVNSRQLLDKGREGGDRWGGERNRGQKGIGASETERNRVFVALLPGSRRD